PRAAEEVGEDGGDARHEDEGVGVAVAPGEFGDVVEVHAVDAGDQGVRHEDDAPGGHRLHHLIEPVGGDGERGVHRAGEQVPVGIDRVERADDVIVDVLHVRHDIR